MTLALSCGEPAGIGPEIAAKAWAALRGEVPLVWIGDPRHLPAGVPVAEVGDASQAAGVCAEALPVLARDFGPAVTPGKAQAAHAPHVVAAIEEAVALTRSGACTGMVTAPIHKQALIDGAGFAYPGHTEFLAALGGVSRVVMMLAAEVLRVVPATIHIPLAQVPAALTEPLLAETIEITRAALIRDFGIAEPRIAVSGLNPHSGEGGKMGREEIELITPLIRRYHDMGWHIFGPVPADTLFHAAARSRYDAAIAMYHDQALIPIKTLAFDEGVNVTLGLPFVRTSPDHGTAFDIAGTGVANPSSMIAAIRMAARMGAARG